jgi:S-DNA-T family DNA segregation ATPase FtsK/SpoIIIE
MAKRGRKRSPFKLKLRLETIYSLGSLLFFALAGLTVISFSGQGESLQAVNDVLRSTFGFAGLLLPFLFICMGLVLTGAKWSFAKPQVLIGSFLFFLSALILGKSGESGRTLFANFSELIQPLGTKIVFALVGLAGFLILTDTSLRELFRYLGSMVEVDKSVREKQAKLKEEEKVKGFSIKGLLSKQKEVEPATAAPVQESFKVNKPMMPAIDLEDTSSTAPLANQPGSQAWEYPPTSLLSAKRGAQADAGDVKTNASTIEQTLDSFGIKAQMVEVNIGPAVTQYAIKPSIGTKLTKITSLANDLALALAAPTGQIRIEAPIPGRDLVGIEVPNRSLQVVSLRQVLMSPEMKKNQSKLAVSLGLDVAGREVVADVAKMPHALIAGATGSGKSVAVNAFIASILFRASPDEVKFILVDPKRVELTQYNDIPHLLTPVITEPKKVVSALKWACAEMDKRYKVFQEVGVRNIAGYNEASGFQAMPYIVIIIDELADIMLFSPSEVEESVTRLAQMARAVGIHLLVSTQRPSVDVITGLIKANIPTRIAFNVSSNTDSRVILDTPGAEKLLGRGDMLYIPPDQAKPVRIQGTFVSDQEIHDLIEFLKKQNKAPTYEEEIVTKFQSNLTHGGPAKGGTDEQDELIKEATRVILEKGEASSSYIQRRLSVGYNRAARILDQLHALGIVGVVNGSKPREINTGAAQQFLQGGPPPSA